MVAVLEMKELNEPLTLEEVNFKVAEAFEWKETKYEELSDFQLSFIRGAIFGYVSGEYRWAIRHDCVLTFPWAAHPLRPTEEEIVEHTKLYMEEINQYIRESHDKIKSGGNFGNEF